MTKQRIAAIVSASALATSVVTAAAVAEATPGPANSAATPIPTPSGTLSDQDRTYLHDDAEGNVFEIRAGRLAARHGRTRAVRAFGRRMVRDHTQAYAELSATAKAVGYADLPTRPSPQQRHLVSLWGGMGKRAFDRAYIGYEWEGHQLDISDAKDEVKDGKNASVRQDAAASLPMLEAHLSRAQYILMHLTR